MMRSMMLGLALSVGSVSALAEPPLAPSEEVAKAADALAEAMRADERALENEDSSRLGKGFGGTFGDELEDGEVRRHRLIKDPDALRDTAREIERAIEDADIFESLADMLIMLSKDVEVVESADSLVLAYRGDELASLEQDGGDRVTLRAGGRRITVEVD